MEHSFVSFVVEPLRCEVPAGRNERRNQVFINHQTAHIKAAHYWTGFKYLGEVVLGIVVDEHSNRII